ncbi:hypothetical protein KSS87_010442 [Heliosperma pusillum]|nr:hypothetical protein KSS87_010442 [Heliosperma pusillum]
MEDSTSSSSSPSNDKKKSSWGLFECSSSSSSLLSSISSKFSVATASFLLFFLFLCTLVLTRWSDISTLASNSVPFAFSMFSKPYNAYPKRDQYLLNCTSSNMTLICPSNYPPPTTNLDSFTSNETCPEYFKWIHEDLSTWKEQGITKELVESLQKEAHFRLTIVNGTAYVKQYQKAFQTRDVYTLWGILQLLKLYPGRLPDLDLMFQCHDQASIKRDKYKGGGAPPQFHYCADDSTLDIVFPDWSFWGWPELSIKPWVPLVKDLEDGNKIKEWNAREHFSFWKGNLKTGARKRLAQCNSIEEWGAQLIDQAQEIGREGSDYISNKIKMEHVYDYMFHVLNEYGKLFKYKPTVPEGAEELCSERFACSPPGLETKYKADTTVTSPSKRAPCALPLPYDRDTLQSIRDRNAKIKEVVEMWERGSG